jgi:hypothetical protein
MGEIGGPEGKPALKPWTKPVLKKIELTEEEAAALRSSDDPMSLLRKLWPKLGVRKPAGK